MNFKTLAAGILAIGVATGVSVLSLSSCGGEVDPSEASLSYLKETHAVETSDLAEDSLLLYVDYSTCVAEAMNSKFFQDVQPTIVSNHPLYFSIKGDKISRENGETYTLLHSVKEVNNADLREAVRQIAAQNRQAVLITDAEYWHPGVGDNLNNPYMKESIGKWLAAGRDIYIYAEPYLESGKYNKKRYYIIFTDDRLNPEININTKMQQAITSLGDVKTLHLTARAPQAALSLDIADDPDGITLFDNSLTKDNFEQGVPLFVFGENIYKIAESLHGASENKAGNPIDLPFVKGIKIPACADGIFNIDDYEVKVYDLTADAIEFATPETDEEGEPVVKKAKWNPVEIDDMFELGEKELENGEFALYFDEKYLENGGSDGPSLLKVDIVVDDAKALTEKNTGVYETLSWDSISKAAQGGRNNSFFESVKQAVINDKSISPEAEGRNVVATFYVFTE